ncbi:MAG: DciA family protein, partial [Desulfovibrionaceae bacterium]|nr:DciA family protein [Desulfovibrionaceae bacterium]
MRARRLLSAREAVERLLRRYPRKTRLARLWGNWSMVMGPELALLAWPLGERKGVLLVGGE